MSAVTNSGTTIQGHPDAIAAAKIFGKANDDGTVSLFHNPDGEVVTRMDEDDGFTSVSVVGSEFGSGYEHPEGITLTAEDAKRLGIETEFPGHRVKTVEVMCRITFAVAPQRGDETAECLVEVFDVPVEVELSADGDWSSARFAGQFDASETIQEKARQLPQRAAEAAVRRLENAGRESDQQRCNEIKYPATERVMKEVMAAGRHLPKSEFLSVAGTREFTGSWRSRRQYENSKGDIAQMVAFNLVTLENSKADVVVDQEPLEEVLWRLRTTMKHEHHISGRCGQIGKLRDEDRERAFALYRSLEGDHLMDRVHYYQDAHLRRLLGSLRNAMNAKGWFTDEKNGEDNG